MTDPRPKPRPAWTPDPGRWTWRDLVALAIWTAFVVAFFWEVVTLRRALFYFDITEINFPYRDFLADELKAGRFSRWHPGLACGLPLYSESQAGYFHPFKYLFYPWMENWQAFGYDCVASVWLAGAATFGWLRRHVRPLGALTGAFILGFGGFTWAHFIHTSMLNALPSVPLAIWALEWAWGRGGWRGVGLAALAMACQIFAGHLQDFLLTAMVLGLYTAYRIATERSRSARLAVGSRALGLVTLAVLLSAVQWVPSKELLDRSPRAGGLTWDQLTYGSWSPELLPTLFVREAYGTRARDTDWMDGFYPYHEMNAYLGVLPLALALVGAAACRDRWVALWVLVGLLGALLMLGRFTCVMDYAQHIPVLGSSRIPVRFHLWVTLAVAALAAVGVDRLARPELGRVRVWWAVALVALLALASLPILYHVYGPLWSFPGRWSSPYHRARTDWLLDDLARGAGLVLLRSVVGMVLIVGAARRWRAFAFALLALPPLIAVDLLGAHSDDVATVDPSYWTIPPASARHVLADPDHQRVSGTGYYSAGEPGYASISIDFPRSRDTLAWSLAPVYGLRSVLGETPMIPRRWKAYWDATEGNPARYEVAGVSHVLSGFDGRFVDWGDSTRVGTAYIWRNPRRLERARIVGHPTYARNEASAVEALRRIGPALATGVLVEDPLRPLPATASPVGLASIDTDLPEHQIITTDSDAEGYLVVADSFDPGWSAALDGTPVPIRPANVNFRAVLVPAGRHTVEFRYEPAGWRAGLIVTAIGSILSVLAFALPRRVAGLRDEHDRLGWPRGWPWLGVLGIFLLLVGSGVRFGPDGPRLHERWVDSLHPFTWGAGIEAMQRASITQGR